MTYNVIKQMKLIKIIGLKKKVNKTKYGKY